MLLFLDYWWNFHFKLSWVISYIKGKEVILYLGVYLNTKEKFRSKFNQFYGLRITVVLPESQLARLNTNSPWLIVGSPGLIRPALDSECL